MEQIIRTGDQVQFMPNFGAAILLAPAITTITGTAATVSAAGMTACVEGDEKTVVLPGIPYMSGSFVTPGTCTLTIQQLGGDQLSRKTKIGGKAVEGCYFTNHYSAEEQRPAVQKLIADYRAKYDGKTPDAMAVLGYDSMRLMADAIQRAGSLDGAAIRDALAATANFSGVSGTITMDANRNAQKNIVVLRIEDGKFRFIESIAP